MNRRWLLAIILLALGLRLVNLSSRSLWYDEAFAVLFAEKGLDAMLYGTLTPVAGGAADIHPLLYYATLNVWMTIFGQTAFAVRLWSALLGVATVIVLYLLGRELFTEKTGLAAAFITAVAPFHVQYSQETRMYALLGLLLALATWCFVRAWRATLPGDWRRGIGWWIGFGLLAGLAMYTQQLAAFYLVALGLVPLVSRRFDRFWRIVLAAGVAVIVYLPWLVNLPGQFEKVRSYYWLQPPTVGTPLLTLRSFLTVSLDYPAPASMIGFLGAMFVVVFLVIQVMLTLRRRRSPDRNRLRFVLWLAAFPPALMWLVSQWQPVYLERALLPSALMLYLALGWLFTRANMPKPVAVLIGTVGLILAGIGLYYQYTWATFPNPPFQAAIETIRQEWQPGDVVVHQDKLTALPMVYYGRDLPQQFLRDAPGTGDDTLALPTQETLGLLADHCVQAASRDARRVWWVVFGFAEEQYSAAGRDAEFRAAIDWLETNFNERDMRVFNDLDVILFAGRVPGALSGDCEVS